jgi:ketosteroid isomerase-like protein
MVTRVPGADRPQLARGVYEAFAAGDRDAIEALLAEDFEFHSPPDPNLDRAGYFERCWPHSGGNQTFEFVRLIESGDEIVVTYEGTRPDGSRFRNTEVLTFAGDRVRRAEVYFGWDLI